MNDYHASWLEQAIKNFKQEYTIHNIDGDMTIDEFINTWCKDELDCIKRV
jgi:hypothetical protein